MQSVSICPLKSLYNKRYRGEKYQRDLQAHLSKINNSTQNINITYKPKMEQHESNHYYDDTGTPRNL